MRVQERWRACNAPVAELIAVEGGGAHPREVDSGQSTRSRVDSSERGGCASESGRERQGEVDSVKAPVAKRIAVESRATSRREVESLQHTCSRIYSGGKGICAPEGGRRRVMHL